MLYFAYGSNMDWAQMADRCPSAKFVTKARLPGHRLAFIRNSPKCGGGVADVVEDSAREVWGVVFEVSDGEIPELDRHEGFRAGRQPNSYWRRDGVVWDDSVEPVAWKVSIYFAERELSPPLPSREYVDQIVRAARHWELPEDYVAMLGGLKTSP